MHDWEAFVNGVRGWKIWVDEGGRTGYTQPSLIVALASKFRAEVFGIFAGGL